MTEKKIKKILKSIRKQLGKYSDDTGYSDSYELGGMCGVCSYVIFKVFRDMGMKPMFHMGDYHCYVTMDGYWIDLTLKQFNNRCPYVYLKRKPYTQDDGYGNVHCLDDTAKTTKKIKKLFRGWDKEQNPFRQKLPEITI